MRKRNSRLDTYMQVTTSTMTHPDEALVSRAKWSLLAVMCLMVSLGASECRSSKERLVAVATEYWENRLLEHPEDASCKGHHVNDHLLEEFTMEAFTRKKLQAEKFLAELEDIDPSQLDPHDLMDYRVLKVTLQIYIDGYEWRNYGALNPLNLMEGLNQHADSLSCNRMETTGDLMGYLARLSRIPQQIDEMIQLMTTAIELGTTNYYTSMANEPKWLDDYTNITALEDSALYRPLIYGVYTSNVNSSMESTILALAEQIIQQEVIPAYERMKNFLIESYMPATRTGAGVGSYPGGSEYYAACLRFHVTKNVTAQQVHDVGLREVARIKTEMEAVMKREGFTGTLKEFFTFLQENKTEEFYGRSQQELLDEYTNLIHNRINPQLHRVFYEQQIPDAMNRIRVVSMTADGPSGAYYRGVFYANVRRSEERPTFLMMALSLHEANPGHHLQIHYTSKISDLEFRNTLWTDKYYPAPFTVPHFTAYVEGWGLYAEYLGVELGVFNSTRLEMIGRYSSEMFRAVRLVIDTGIHAFGMTRDEAISYLAEYTAIPLVQIEKEVDRYIMWPGQACAYKMGEISMLQLRQEAEEALGDKFDIKEFHAQVLNVGRVPLQFLEDHIHAWIQETLSTGSSTAVSTAALSAMQMVVISLACCVLVSVVY